MSKICTKCEIDLQIDDFSRDRVAKDGRKSWCKKCSYTATQAWKVKNLDRFNALQRKCWLKHKAKRNSEQRAAYDKAIQSNPEEARSLRSERAKREIETKRAWNRNYRENNRGAYNAMLRSWKKDHPESRRTAAARRRAYKLSSGGSYTPLEAYVLRQIYGDKCLACGKTSSEIKLTDDHIVPLSKGGPNTVANLQPLCLPCNIGKNDKTIDYRPFVPRIIGLRTLSMMEGG